MASKKSGCSGEQNASISVRHFVARIARLVAAFNLNLNGIRVKMVKNRAFGHMGHDPLATAPTHFRPILSRIAQLLDCQFDPIDLLACDPVASARSSITWSMALRAAR
jgi:hypothetical protein